MNKKLLLASVGALAIGASGLSAQTPAPAAAPAVSVTATASVVSQYMFRGQRLNGAGFQPSVEVGAGDLAVGVWTNFPLEDKVPDSSDPEIDLYGSYTFKLSDAASLVPGFTSYHYPSAPKGVGLYRWTFEPSLALNYTVEGFKFTPKVYYDTVLEGATYEITGTFAIPMKEIGSEIDFTATAGTYKLKEAADDTSPAVKSWGDYWLIGIAMPFQIAPNQKLTLGLAYTEGTNAFTKQGSLPQSVNSLAVGRGFGTISYSFSF